MEVKVTVQGLSHSEAKIVTHALRPSLEPDTLAVTSEGETYTVERDRGGVPFYEPGRTGKHDPWAEIVRQHAPVLTIVLPIVGAAAEKTVEIIVKQLISYYAERKKAEPGTATIPRLRIYGPDGTVVSEFSSQELKTGKLQHPFPSDLPS